MGKPGSQVWSLEGSEQVSLPGSDILLSGSEETLAAMPSALAAQACEAWLTHVLQWWLILPSQV